MSAVNPIQHLDVNVSELKKRQPVYGSSTELSQAVKAILDNKIHGISFSAYEEGQDPEIKSQLSDEQIRRRLEIIKPHTEWIRTFSCTNGNERIPVIAREMGLKTMVGAWIDDESDRNEAEIAGLLKIMKEGYADIAAVGNEVLLREDMTAKELVSLIKRVKAEVPEVTVGYVDAYYEFKDCPELVDVCDVILANCYPFWEYCNVEHSVEYMKLMYETAVAAAKGKQVIITETGWPSQGEVLGGAVPSSDNAMAYFVSTYEWAEEEGVDIIYFTSFDEDWKVSKEGDCGAYWGLWDKYGQFKYE